MTGSTPVRICLAIATFKGDASVKQLLETVAGFRPKPFERVFVVDSLGSGEIPAFIAERGWGDWVEYVSFDSNLGSAGNLYQRLAIPAERGFDFVYALNHDGKINVATVDALVAFARDHRGAGAIYPLRRFPGRQNRFDLTGRTRFPMMFSGTSEPPATAHVEAFWGSSNGALYSLEPVRQGIAPFPDFWMGWEDLAYGWLLTEKGYAQYVVTAAVVVDDYEYTTRGLGPLHFTITDKPPWYSYYSFRNLLLALRRVRMEPKVAAAVLIRMVGEVGVTTLLRDRKGERLRLFAEGVKDGILGRSGKGRVP